MGNTPTTHKALASETIAAPPASTRSDRSGPSEHADTPSGPPARAVSLYVALVLVLMVRVHHQVRLPRPNNE